MRSLPYWIQRADFSSTNFEPVDVTGALRAFSTHDWSAELHVLSELEERAGRCCPPGIGFVAPDGAILHVAPTRDGRALVHYHAVRVRKLFGFLPIGGYVHSRQGVERSEVVEMIHSFFAGRHESLLRKLA